MAQVAALAGRRIDAADAAGARFPLANAEVVRARLQALLRAEQGRALVCSAACGADLIARLALAYLDEASVRAAIDPDGAEHERFFAHLRRLIALDVEHQIREAGLAVDPTRLPKRK